ncbi:hypothetical protein RVBP16_3720 [Pseudomonas phage sp. 30-2]|nr:hypothetical protein RVBP16_3720 [Pseudomonas phage sp. 30-2]
MLILEISSRIRVIRYHTFLNAKYTLFNSIPNLSMYKIGIDVDDNVISIIVYQTYEQDIFNF